MFAIKRVFSTKGKHFVYLLWVNPKEPIENKSVFTYASKITPLTFAHTTLCFKPVNIFMFNNTCSLVHTKNILRVHNFL